jgi:hypothetical protein
MSSGMIVSRLGIQASAVDDLVHGLICLRVGQSPTTSHYEIAHMLSGLFTSGE